MESAESLCDMAGSVRADELAAIDAMAGTRVGLVLAVLKCARSREPALKKTATAAFVHLLHELGANGRR